MTSTTSAALSSEGVPRSGDWRSLFPTRRELLATLLDGSRHSGATTVDIEYQEQPGILRITDNGSLSVGPKTLGAVRAEIDRDPFIIEEMRHDLLRYAAVLACADRVKVHTPAYSVTLRADPFLTVKEAHPVSIATIGNSVTFVFELAKELRTDPRTLRQELLTLARGYALPTHFNGLELTRPLALNQDLFVQFAHGHYLFDRNAWPREHHIFLNGLPVDRGDGKPTYIPDGFVVHLHPEIFCSAPPGHEEIVGGAITLAFLRHELQRITGTLEPLPA